MKGGIHLHQKWKDALAHALASYLFSLGMALTLLGVTGLMRHGYLAAAILAGISAAAVPAAVNRPVRIAAGCLALFSAAVALCIGGISTLNEVFQALLLHMSGLLTALPMVGVPFTVIICLLCAAVSWFVTQRSAGAFPALILLVLTAVLLWLGSWSEVFICLLPATIAVVTLLLRAGDEQTSTFRVLPLAAAVTALAFTGVAMGGSVSAPLKSLADSIRQRIYDTFFYTQPRDVFTLATEGYYPQGISQLGGPAVPREEPVMAVITPRKTYLRGVVKNIYTGRTWLDDLGGRRYLFSSSRFADLRKTTFNEELPLLEAGLDTSLLTTQTLQVRMLQDSASTLFVPQRLRSLSAEGSLTPYFNASSELFATANLTLGDVWTVEAALFTANDSGIEALVNAAETSSDAQWDSICESYMQLHDDIDSRVYDMAASATNGASTPFAKAMAIQRYLAATCTYTLDAPEQSTQHDFVSTFLIEGKKGYCTYFASAMTVMCRMAGLPARYVEGYVANPDEEGLAIVTGKDGHAWTEVYFRGFGWVTFDATPVSADYVGIPPDSANTEQDSPPEASPSPSPEPTATPAPSATPEASPSPSDQPSAEPEASPQPSASPAPRNADASDVSHGQMGWMLLLLLLLAMTVRIVMVQPGIQARRQKTEFGRWLVWVQASHDALLCCGLRRDASESPAAFFRRAESSGLVTMSLQGLSAAENLMFYGHAAPYTEETAQARAAFTTLYRQLPFRRRIHFHLHRAFIPRKRQTFTL